MAFVSKFLIFLLTTQSHGASNDQNDTQTGERAPFVAQKTKNKAA